MNNKLKINVTFFLFLSYIIFILINDYLCFIFKTNYDILLYIISLIIYFLLYFILRKKIELIKDRFCRIDILFIIIILGIWLARLPIPDSSFDTLNYHLYLQERLFSNNVNFNFFPARWINTFSFPLGDRLHFLFRTIFGYRLGMISNVFCMVVIYFQTKIILSKFIKKVYYIPIFSILILLTEQLCTNMITYYVDLFSIPLFLEIIIVLLYAKKTDNKTNYLVLLLSGILISLKISNAFFIIILGIIYIIKNKDSINIKTFLIGIPIVILPIFIYMVNNYIQTGNPVFPFYNSIFESKYLPNSNWIETAYGPKTLIERILWPIIILKYPRRAFDTDIYYGRIGFGFIISLLFILFQIKNYKKSNEFKLSILYVIMCLIWSNFMMGYIRYALILEIISGIISVLFVYNYFKSKNNIIFITSLLVLISLGHVFYNTLSDIFKSSTELSWRYPYSLNKEDYKKNIRYVMDRPKKYDKYTSNIDCFGIVDYNSGYAALLSKKAKIININEGYNSAYGERKFNKIINECKNTYTVSTSSNLERTEKYLKAANYERNGENIEFKTDFLNINSEIILFEITKVN